MESPRKLYSIPSTRMTFVLVNLQIKLPALNIRGTPGEVIRRTNLELYHIWQAC